jgi:valine--pyruvate aminotransferase
MALSFCGTKMTKMSGLRSIMEDVAAAKADGSAGRWLNLGIGNPALIPEAVAMWRRLAEEALADSFEAASCQYGPSRGTARLVSAIIAYFGKAYGWDLTEQNVVVGPGSQMLCFIAAALFAGQGATGTRPVVLSVPDYAGYQGLCMNADGLAGITSRVNLLNNRRFLYSIDHEALRSYPDIGLMLLSSPCNPTGRCVDATDLSALIDVAERQDSLVLIDNAYGEPFPRVAEVLVPPVWHENVINCFSVSKAGLPGDRIGFAIGASRHIDAMVSFIANSSLHAPQLPQMVLTRALETGCLDDLARSVIRPYYLARRESAEKMLHESLPDSVDWRLHAGQGGMFCWLWVNEPWFADTELYQLLKRKRVVIVPGRSFFTDPMCLGGHGTRCFRISVTPDESVLREGVQHIAETLDELHRERSRVVDLCQYANHLVKEKTCTPTRGTGRR